MGFDPFGGSTITSGESYDLTGGPLGFLKALVFFVALVAVVVLVVGGLESAFLAVVPEWAALPLVIVVAIGLVAGGLFAVLRFNEWRRYR